MSTVEIVVYSLTALAAMGIAVAISFNIGYWRGFRRGRSVRFSESLFKELAAVDSGAEHEMPLNLGWGDEDESEHSSFAPEITPASWPSHTP